MNQTIESPSFKIQLTDMQVTGSSHTQCQDVIYSKCDSKLLLAGIADGKSEARYSREGGITVLEAVADYIASVGMSTLVHARFPDELPCTVVATFRSALQKLAQAHQASFQEFASTLLLLAIDLVTGQYLALHLGDGCILGISQEGDIFPISQPENGLTMYHTWLTTSDSAVFHLRISYGNVHKKGRILLMTSGAACFCWNRSVPHRAQELIASAPPENLYRRLAQSEPADDASCIILDFLDQTSQDRSSEFHD